MSKWQWIFRQLRSRLWLRASIFCIVGVVSALLGLLVKGYVPPAISEHIGADAVDDILKIIASSMLAVTTFSLSVMVSAYAAAASGASPRATKLLLSDPSSQNALSTFIGTFLFSIVGIIALKMGVYGESGRFLLFVVTLLVIMFFVLTLLHWIEYLSRLGRVGHTIDMVEKAATKSIEYYCREPYFGGVPSPDFTPGPYHAGITNPTIGYVQHVDMGILDSVAEKMKKPIYLSRRPGAFNDSRTPLAYVDAPMDEDFVEKIRSAFIISGDRSFEQDPRYGLIVLSEIALRALSPAVNDPGTAIDVIGTLVRVLAPIAKVNGKAPQTEDGEEPEEYDFPNVHVQPMQMSDIFNDSFNAIARDGASMAEVGLRLQKAFITLEDMKNDAFRREARLHAGYALRHSLEALPLDEDKDMLKSVALAPPVLMDSEATKESEKTETP